ncbi:hypothetical protein LEP1GSC058_0307 [Leptospira fainei serovar Hurstbridge str. BUT 6]|uniref:Uncharacterized protein n=1 Tax=Leptospira fainei serovar Hurstbridge str. BUT 6 TaxID=1193011 RepID=S3VHV3_9LEPT|nr:hypothetical protein [Leptospira fainei]EPG76010.1 hypothetical protein LEP1GSC058_0307 [Leptospira fainei serovar Hurstbridge str. BUT 6]
MPIDKMMSDPMLGTFRNMVQECKDKNLSGPAFDSMLAEMNKMEKYAADMDDFGAFSAKLMTEGCFANFSAAYSQVLAGSAKSASQSSGSDIDEDEGFLKQTLSAYQSALDRYEDDVKKGIMKPKTAALLRVGVQAVIDLGKSGITYPVFLRLLIEKGLDKVMEGSAVLRDGLVTDIDWAKFYNLPLYIQRGEEILSKFDELAAKATFKVPDSFEFGLARREIEWKHEPAIIKWKAITERWEKLIDIVNDWLDSYTNFAPKDERWVDPTNPSATPKNIRRTKELSPFRLRERERILSESFNLSWNDIFTHETYLLAWTNVDVSISASKIELLKKAYPLCKPGGAPTEELIKEAEGLHATKSDWRIAERIAVGEKMKAKYDELYGAGAYDKEFGSK